MDIFTFIPSFGWATVVQLLAFLGAVWGICHQIKKQGELQRTDHKNKILITIYENLTSDIENSSPVAVATSLHILAGALDNAIKQEVKIKQYVPPPFKAEDIHKSYTQIHNKLWNILFTLEKYEIISPNITLFRKIISIKVQELNDAYLPIIKILPYLLLSEQGINDTTILFETTKKVLSEFEKKVASFYEISFEVASYLEDIKIEGQNILLGKFFNNRVPARSPVDKNLLVLTSEDEAMLSTARETLRKLEKNQIEQINNFSNQPH